MNKMHGLCCMHCHNTIAISNNEYVDLTLAQERLDKHQVGYEHMIVRPAIVDCVIGCCDDPCYIWQHDDDDELCGYTILKE